MSMDIPLTSKVNHRTGLSEVSDARRDNISAIRLLFYADSLFWLVGVIGAAGQNGGVPFRDCDLYDALEHVGELGAAILMTALPHIDNLEKLAERK